MVEPLFASADLFGAAGQEAVRVALPVPVDELFDYAVPAAWRDRARPGCRVQVRFRERALTGVIVERGRGADFTGPLRAIEQLIDPEPVLAPELLQVLREEAAAVLCPLGLALATALPSGSAPRQVPGLALTPRGRAALRSGALRGTAREVLESLAERPAPRASLQRRVRGADLGALLGDGLVEASAVERGPSARAAHLRFACPVPGLDLDALATGALARAPRQLALLRRLAERGPTPAAELAREFSAGLVRALRTRGLLEIEQRAAPRDVLGPPLEAGGPAPTPSEEQAAALRPLVDAIRARRFETFLLHGVTGSGKTEVYLRAVGETLALGRQALVLVPEITLTHQILARLRGRFGDDLAVLHSGLRPGERLEQWQLLREGATPIAVGARSALFAPLENLGLIVIDEEHDGAYKNDEGFRYHARDLARRRAARSGCPLVLGSATPCLETRFAADRGELRRLTLRQRVGPQPLPQVQVVDMARERELQPSGRKLVLSRPLRDALGQTLGDGGQAILFLNRRGFSTQIFCFDCGHAERCENCDIALVYHAPERALRCHYCDHRADPPQRCGGCGAPDTALLGIGTQRLEEEVRSLFPDARIARLDRDTARRRGHVEQVLRGLRHGGLDVVVGTQMVAKGHDFPGVRLVGVVAADLSLHLPDFRAAERTFQLLTQVAGRAGRDTAPGRVILQTFSPDHYAIAPVREHDYERFYAEELSHRERLGYPPFGGLVHALVSSPDADAALRAAGELADRAAPPPAPAGLEVLGPAPAPLSRLRGRYRFQLLVKGADREALHAAARRLCDAAAQLPDGVQASVDVNPLNML